MTGLTEFEKKQREKELKGLLNALDSLKEESEPDTSAKTARAATFSNYYDLKLKRQAEELAYKDSKKE